MSTPSKPLSTYDILQESIKLPTKNLALILPIFLLYLFFSYLLYFINHLSITPLFTDLVRHTFAISFLNNSQNPNFLEPLHSIRKDIRELVIIESAFFITAFAISCILTIAIIHVLSCAYVHPHNFLTHMDVISKLKQSFQGPMITQLYVGIFHLGYLFLTLAWVSILLLFYLPNSLFFLFSSVFQVIIILLILSYLAIVWFISIVISVVEEGCYGLIAIGKAAKLIRGKRMQGTFIIFIEMVVITIIHAAYYQFMADLHRSPATRLVVGFVYLCIYLVINMIVWATSTIFYYECVRVHSEIAEIAMDNGSEYSSLSTSTNARHIDEGSLKLISEV